ncbi:putative ribonuclease H-like domain-containing protein, partial [Tanacetum coccineum]
DDILFGSSKKSLCDEFEQIMHNRFQMSSMGELTFFLGLHVKLKEDGIFISQDKYVGEILKNFSFSSIRTTSTPMETNKALTKDEDGEDVDVHLYRSMIGSLMYLTSSRPDIMFSVCACSRFQVQPKFSHLNAVKRIFRYLKGQPKLGLWYPKDSPLILEAFSDSDYAGTSLDKKSTTGGCQFLSSSALDPKSDVGNKSAICVVKNPVYHSKTKHIEIRHHFIRDSYEKRLIKMVKIHTDHNVADLLTKAFDVSGFNFLVASIGKRGRDTKIPQSGGTLIKVGDEAVHKELGDRMERVATTASCLEVEQDSDAPTRFEAASKSPMTQLSQELTHLDVGRTKSEGSEGFHQIIDFLNASHIQYTLTENPIIYVSFIKQFWSTTTTRTSANGEVELTTTIDGQVKTITEASLKRHIKLEDNDGITTLPNSEIFEQLALMGRDEGSVSLNELTNLYTSLSKKVGALENELQQTKKTYSTAITKLIFRVKKLEQKVKTTKAQRRARIVLSEDVEDSSKQGRKISAIDTNPTIYLVQPEQEMEHDVGIAEEMTWFQDADAEIKEKNRADTEIILEEEQPTELVEDIGSGEKGASEQEKLGHEEAVRLQEQLNEEETQRITRDAEIARQLHEEINKAGQERVVAKDDQAHVIDWSDPAVLRYHAQLNRDQNS